MTSDRLRIGTTTLVVALSAVISIASVASRVTTPSAGVVLSGPVIEAGAGTVAGVEVAPAGATGGPLRAGDIVTTIAGRPVEAWLADLGDTSARRLVPAAGDVITIGFSRNGVRGTAQVAARPFPTLEVLAAAIGTLAFVVAFFVLAAGVFLIRPANPAAGAFLLAGTGALGSTVPFLLGIDVLDLATGRVWLHAVSVNLVYMLLWAGAIDWALTFPRPLPALARRPALRLVPYVAVFAPFAVAMVVARAAAPDALGWFGSWASIQLLVLGPALGIAIAILVRRWRTATAEDRRILRGVAVAGSFTFLANMVVWITPELLTGRPLIPWTVAGVIGLPLILAVAAAIVRHHAFDIDVVVRRSIAYGAAFVGVISVYAVSVLVFSNALGAGASFAAQLLSVGIATVAALPIRDLAQRAVVRLLYGDRDEPVVAIRRLSERMTWSADPSTLPAVVVDTVAGALRSPYVALELGAPETARTVARTGAPIGGALEIPLVHQSRTVGRLVVAARSAVDPFSAADLALLRDLANQVAAAVDASVLAEDLQRSRERIVAAGEDERRRLRRDLHDGLGPTLAAIGMRADAVAARLGSGSEPGADLDLARTELDRLRADVELAVADVRRVVDGLRPPALDEFGLVEALRMAADRMAASEETPAMTVDADGNLSALSAAVEVAAYRIATEAMTNAARHAGAAHCSIRIRGGDALTIEIEDDGSGLGEATREGVGLASMRERAEELGGEWRAESGPTGGTRIVARLPLGSGGTIGSGP